MSRRDAAQALGLVAYTEARLKAIKKRLVGLIDVELPEEKLCGSIQVDGRKEPVIVSTSTRVQPAPKLRVEDDDRFVAWVQERWPEHIVPAISPKWLEELKARMLEHPQGLLEDAEGEMCMWVELEEPTPYTTTRLTKHADALEPLLERRSLADLLAYIEEEPVYLDEEAK